MISQILFSHVFHNIIIFPFFLILMVFIFFLLENYNFNFFTLLVLLASTYLMNTISKEWPVVLALAQKLINSKSSNKRIKFIKEMYRSFPDKEMVNKMKFSKKYFLILKVC